MEEMFASIEDLLENEISIDCVGHRVVHGGEKFFKASVIDKEVTRGIEACVNLAPLHNPANLKGIEIAMKKFKKCTHVAVFDTAFHQSIPETAYIYLLPRKLYEECGVLGLSGLSSDIRTITNAAKQWHRGATLAVDVFAYHLTQAIVRLSVNFRRLDALVFTGGIGEHSATIRSKTLRQLRILGFDLDRLRNRIDGKESQGIITVKGVEPVAIVVPTNEQMQIAWKCSDLLKSG